jgi:glyoxylase I family protein
MRVTRIGWAGTRTDHYSAMVEFLTAVLGPSVPDNRYFTTGPVVGFVIEDLPAAVAELERAGVELLGGHVDERGQGWRHFRAPDGNVYELGSN